MFLTTLQKKRTLGLGKKKKMQPDFGCLYKDPQHLVMKWLSVLSVTLELR